VKSINVFNIFLVVLLVLASTNPCAAFATDGGGPAPGQREPKMLPAVAVGGYVITNTELIAILVGSVGGFVGYTTISVDKDGFDDVLHHLGEFEERVTDFLNGIMDGILHFGSHDVQVYRPNSPGFSLIEQRYNIAKAAKDSYEDSKRKGIPVPGNHDEADDFHKMPDDGNAYSSAWLFNCQADKDNGCPKQIRYFNEKGERDMDIDFSHGDGVDQCVKDGVFPHKHYWRNGMRDERHIYEGIEEIIRNWRCKKYNFKKGIWCP
jgi:hypothetical protein